MVQRIPTARFFRRRTTRVDPRRNTEYERSVHSAGAVKSTHDAVRQRCFQALRTNQERIVSKEMRVPSEAFPCRTGMARCSVLLTTQRFSRRAAAAIAAKRRLETRVRRLNPIHDPRVRRHTRSLLVTAKFPK